MCKMLIFSLFFTYVWLLIYRRFARSRISKVLSLILILLCAIQTVLPHHYPPRATSLVPPGTSLFLVAPVFLSLFSYLAPPQLITLIPSFSSALPFFQFIFQFPALFNKHIFPPILGLPVGDRVGTFSPTQYA